MNDELPAAFQSLTPRPAPGELRSRVLAAVSEQLAAAPRRPTPSWERVCQWSVAAALLLGIGLNAWRWQADRNFQARVFGPRPTATRLADVAAAVESVTDRQTARRLSERLQAARDWGATTTDHSQSAYWRWIERTAREAKGAAI